MKLLEVRFDRILHSPKLRAVQTAELLEPLLDGKLDQTPLLAISPAAGVLDLLFGDVIAVVGHEPHFSTLLAWLVTGEATLGGAFELKKGSVARLEGAPTPAGMRLRSLLPPSTCGWSRGECGTPDRPTMGSRPRTVQIQILIQQNQSSLLEPRNGFFSTEAR